MTVQYTRKGVDELLGDLGDLDAATEASYGPGKLRKTAKEECFDCQGRGLTPFPIIETCATCLGRGRVETRHWIYAPNGVENKIFSPVKLTDDQNRIIILKENKIKRIDRKGAMRAMEAKRES